MTNLLKNIVVFIVVAIIIITAFFVVGNISQASGDIIGWWNFSGSISDSSGNGLTSSLVNSADISSGYLNVPGGSGSYFSIDDNDLLSFGNGANDQPFSLNFWLYNNEENTNYNILRKGATSTAEFYLYINTLGRPIMRIYDGLDYQNYIGRFANQSIISDEWKLLTITYDGSKASSGIKIYLNGTRIDTTTSENNAALYFGMDNFSSNLNIGVSTANMKFDDIRIYSKELTQTEIETIYNNTVDQYTDYNVDITATVDPTLSLSLSANTCDFDTFDINKIRTCSYRADVATNAVSGYTAYIRENKDLKHTNGTDSISDVTDSEITGNETSKEEYGLGIDTQDTPIIFPDYSGVDTCLNLDNQSTNGLPAEPIITSDQAFATSGVPVDGISTGQTTLCHGASITATTEAGYYSNIITITAVGNF